MARNATNRRPAPQPTHKAKGADDNVAVQAQADDKGNVSSIKQGGTRAPSNFFLQATSRDDERVKDKLTIIGGCKQRLAEAFDKYREGGKAADEAKSIADKAAVPLYQARAKGVLSAAEISAMLGDVFGYKPKQDGTPGKTPQGEGEAIRKRIVRLVQADDYVNGRDVPAFFDGLDSEAISDVLGRVSEGELTIWQAYERFADIKRDGSERTKAAFNPKAIAGIVETLSENGAAEKVAANDALIAAYGALMKMLDTVGQAVAAIREEGE